MAFAVKLLLDSASFLDIGSPLNKIVQLLGRCLSHFVVNLAVLVQDFGAAKPLRKDKHLLEILQAGLGLLVHESYVLDVDVVQDFHVDESLTEIEMLQCCFNFFTCLLSASSWAAIKFELQGQTGFIAVFCALKILHSCKQTDSLFKNINADSGQFVPQFGIVGMLSPFAQNLIQKSVCVL